jgi:hypothetical protein
MDECVNFLVSRYGYANEPNGVKFYDLDNEPALWFSTHPRIHPVKTLCTELVSRNVALASAVKDVDPCAQILGPVLYGFNAYHSFQDACDWPALQNGYNWFLDYYLDRMKANSVAAGKRLLDVLDLHWYSNAIGDGKLIVFEPPPYSRANAKARMQAPRTLWDPDYLEDSWIATYHSDHLPLLPEVWESINTYYSGTKLSFTEYAYGAENHFSGGIATADVLGIFGKYGVYIATYYPVFGDNNYLDTAFKMYRNYDGNNSMFGDMNVLASMSNKVDSSIYASVSTIDANALHLIVINKNFDNAINGTFNITSPQNFISGRVWRFDSSSPTITETTGISSITNNTFKYTIPSLTVCHIVLQTGTSLTITKCKVTSGKTQYHNDADYNDMKDTFEASGFITLPRDCNDINSVEVNITSVTDDEVIYTETLRDFNATLVNNKGKYTHSAKVYKGQPGKITSLTLNFRKGTFAIKAKNIDLTGLACPVQLGFTIGSYEVSGLAEETVVNGSKKSIPARLMRLYKDTLIVTKAKAKNSTNALSDSLSVSGEIAVTDINDANMNEPNLVTQDVNIVWGDQTFTIPTGSFKAAKSGHSYKCSKINVDPGASADINDGFVTATINLDKCTFTISISKADLVATSGDVEFGINFDVFNETEDLTLP